MGLKVLWNFQGSNYSIMSLRQSVGSIESINDADISLQRSTLLEAPVSSRNLVATRKSPFPSQNRSLEANGTTRSRTSRCGFPLLRLESSVHREGGPTRARGRSIVTDSGLSQLLELVSPSGGEGSYWPRVIDGGSTPCDEQSAVQILVDKNLCSPMLSVVD